MVMMVVFLMLDRKSIWNLKDEVILMITKENFSTEQLEWIKKQLELRRQLSRFMTVKLYGSIDNWLTDDEHILAFCTEYMALVVSELQGNLSKVNYEKVKLIMVQDNYLSINM